MKRVIWLSLILGVWLIVAPIFVGSFPASSVAAANDVTLGVFLIAASWWVLGAIVVIVSLLETWVFVRAPHQSRVKLP